VPEGSVVATQAHSAVDETQSIAPFKLRLPAQVSFLLNRQTLIAGIVLLVAASAIFVWRIKAHSQRTLEEERARLENLNLIAFEKKVRAAIASKQIEFWQGHQNARAVARFKESYFVATDGGLVQLDSSGRLLKHYSVLDGLPESDLLSLTSFDAKLFIGTRAAGLVSFDGERFESYRWLDRAPQSINALFADSGRLLIGTAAGGLLEFDGRQFRELKVGADRQRISGIIYLAKEGTRLFVGTFAEGLWVEEGARWSHFTMADGLPSNRVVGAAGDARNLYVASDYGLASASYSDFPAEPRQPAGKLFRLVAVLPSLATIARFGENILLAKDNGESFAVRVDQDKDRLPQLILLGGSRPAAVAGYRLVVLERELWALSTDGIRRSGLDAGDGKVNPSSLLAMDQSGLQGEQAHAVAGAPGNYLTNNLISALAVDTRGRLWAGGFRNGIDVLGPEGKRLAHLESDSLREINSLIEDQKTKTMLAATSQGLLTFDLDLRATERLTTGEGLLSNSVMQVAQADAGTEVESTTRNGGAHDHSSLVFATGKGLTIGVRGKLHSLTTVQGLPSNSLYTVLVQGRNLYAGTLSGLALIQDGRVVRVFKDTNSNLTTNWVTALCVVGSRLFVGTYGGGVFELTAAGEFVAYVADTGRAVVNPNAMWSDGARLYVGTLDGALMFDLHSQKWKHVVAELPSRAVLSVSGDDQYVYFGTTSGIARIERSYWDQPE